MSETGVKSNATLSEILTLIASESSILILAHPFPDADAIYSTALLARLNRLRGNTPVAILPHEPPEGPIEVLKLSGEPIPLTPPLEGTIEVNTLVAVEMGHSKRLTQAMRALKAEIKFKRLINIDHHRSNDTFGDIYYVDPNAPSNTYIVYQGLSALKWEIDDVTAALILGGIIGDTSTFRNSNTTPEVLRVSALLNEKLSRVGWEELIKLTEAGTYKSKLLACNAMKRVSDLRVGDKLIRATYLSESDLKSIDATNKDTEGIISQLSSYLPIPHVIILARYEPSTSMTKVSLRTMLKELNLSEIASEYGGGGHSRAAGFITSLPPEIILEELLNLISERLQRKR